MVKNKKIISMFILIFILFVMTGCSKNNKEDLQNKASTEIGYLNTKMIDMLNSLNNITFENYTVISKKVKLSEESQTAQSKETGNASDAQQNPKQEGESQSDSGEEKIR